VINGACVSAAAPSDHDRFGRSAEIETLVTVCEDKMRSGHRGADRTRRDQASMDQTSSTSLIIPVDAAAELQPFRIRYLHRPGVTMPPHVTVLSPFLPIGAIDADVRETLRTTCATFPPFAFTLARLRSFADTGVLYLEPEPVEALLALQRAIAAACRVVAPDSPVFHLTLAGLHPGGLDPIAEEFVRRFGAQLPMAAQATQVCLFELRGAVWLEQACFALQS